jgi:hypothetical protein
MTRIVWDASIRSLDEAIVKAVPLLGLAARAAVPAAKKLAPIAAKKIGAEAAPKLMDAAKGKITGLLDQKRQQEQQLAETEQQIETSEQEQEMEQPEQQEQQTPPPTEQPMPPQATAGSEITGMKGGDQPSNPTEQPGTTATPTVGVSNSFFKDEIGMSGSDLIELFEKAGETSAIPAVVELLRQEQHAVLKAFDWWDENDWGILELQDNDFNLLTLYPERLEYQLRKTVASVKRVESTEEREAIWKSWHDRLNAEQRLSRRERSVLKECLNILQKHGDMNASTITSYGVEATAPEVAGLIKTYGHLFDMKVVGKGTKHDDRTLHYGANKPPVFLKRIDSFIGNLWEVGGEMSITKAGVPRLALPFSTKRAVDYTNVLKRELGVEDIMWEGRQFLIEGDRAVYEAAKVALPYLEKQFSEAAILLSALEGDENAGRIIAFNQAKPEDQVSMLKTWNTSIDGLEEWKEVIVNDRR